MMKETVCAVAFMLLSSVSGIAVADDEKLDVVLTGASFAVPENGWFELACEELGVNPINKAISAEAIYHTANRMAEGTFYTFEELEDMDVLVIDHVHNQDVANEQWLKDDYHDYTMPTTNYAIAYDYVIKKYKDDCYQLKFNPESKYYNTESGKPAYIVLCTHWHDSRVTYNTAIRKLAEKWDLPLVKFDDNIGFTRKELVDGKQPSLAYAKDSEWIYGIEFGWHPKRGQSEYIQQKMAQIFVSEMSDFLGIDNPLTVTVEPKDFAVMEGEEPCVRFSFSNYSPWNFSYQVNNDVFEVENVLTNPYMVKLPASAVEQPVRPLEVSNSMIASGVADGEVVVDLADELVRASYDSYVQESYKDKSYASEPKLELKTGDQWSRQIYLTFPTERIADDVKRVVLRLFFNTTNTADNVVLGLEGNGETYDAKLNWNNKNKYPFEQLDNSTVLYATEVGSYLSWDVTDWVRTMKETSANVTFRISVLEGGSPLCAFASNESDTPELAPALLLVSDKGSSSVDDLNSDETQLPFFSGNVLELPDTNSDASVFGIDGKLIYRGNEDRVDASLWSPGVYFVSWTNCGRPQCVKLVKP